MLGSCICSVPHDLQGIRILRSNDGIEVRIDIPNKRPEPVFQGLAATPMAYVEEALYDELFLTQELISLLRFSLRFNLSTLFLCIFSAIFSYRSFSSLAARFSLSAVILLCDTESKVSR